MSAAAHSLHRRVALLVTAVAVLLAGRAAALDVGAQALLLAAAVVVTGLPHGAVDHLRAEPVLRPSFGRLWLPAFLALYTGVAALVAGAWWLWPVPSLFAFLALSLHHFGSGDARDAIGVLAHGSTPILMPCVAHPEATAALFALLTGGEASAWARGLQTAQPWLLAGWGAALAGLLLARRRGPYGPVGELLAIAAAGWWLPPLLSFGLYFCVWHAPRHILQVCQELWPGPVRPALRRFGRAAIAMTIAAVVGGVAVAWAMPGEPDVLRRGLQLVFVGLAALTVPHLLVTEALRRRQAAPVPAAA